VIADSRSYACASRRDGGPDACSNSLRVPRDLVESAIFDSVAEELLDPAWLSEFGTWFRQQVELGHRARLAATDAAIKRQGTLEQEIRNTVDAIATGGLQSSRALAEKLRELEAERDRLPRKPPARNEVVSMIPRLAELFHEKVKELPQLAKADPDRARMLLRRLIGGSLRLVPEDGRLVAEFELNGNRLALFSSSQPVSREIGGSGGRI
jgi:hypothetical protein